MRMSEVEKKEFLSYINDFLSHEKIQEMKYYIQHGNTSTLTHCILVAYYSYLLSLRLPIPMNQQSIVRGSMLHDFYLYDWHVPDKSHRLHGFKHPSFALRNATKYFELNAIEQDIIEKHMWPLTIRKIPICREAILVNLVDKYCSLAETLFFTLKPKEIKMLLQVLSAY